MYDASAAAGPEMTATSFAACLEVTATSSSMQYDDAASLDLPSRSQQLFGEAIVEDGLFILTLVTRILRNGKTCNGMTILVVRSFVRTIAAIR